MPAGLRRRTVRLRTLLLLLTAFGLVPLALIGAWGVRAALDHQRQTLERSMLSLSRALGSAVESELEGNMSALRTLSYAPSLARGDLPAFYALASDVVRSRPDWAGIILTDASGRLRFKTALPYGATDGRVIDPASLNEVIRSREPTVGTVARGQVQPAAVPVRIPVMVDGQLRYVLSAALKPDRMLAILRRQQVPAGWVVSIHERNDLRVARSVDHERTVGTALSPSTSALLRNAGLDGVGTSYTVDGQEVLTAFTRLPRYHWSVVVGAPTSLLKQMLWRGASVIAAGIVLSLLACVVAALAISRKIVKATSALQQQASRLGTGHPVQVVPNPIHELDEVGRALQTASDLRQDSERERTALLKSLQDALDRAREAGEAKDQFMAVLGHELRNPLAPMVTALDLMDVRDTAAFAREREILRRQVGHMKRLVDDLLDLSRITRGTLAIEKVPVNLATVVHSVLEATQPALKERAGTIAIDVDPEAWIVGDEARLVQVVTNLLNNALRFDPEGEIRVAVRVQDAHALLIVRDHGIGMTPEQTREVFTPFYQAPQPLVRSTGGLGLGLAIVRNIVELHGGNIAARSDGLGCGTTVELRLPAVASAAIPPPATTLPAAVTGRRVLVVDDNVDAAQTVSGLLSALGHDVQAVHHPYAALERFEQNPPEVAILDIGLPEMDGFALAQTLRRRHPHWPGQLVALTGYGAAADRARTREAGFAVHLTKPVDLAQLQQALEPVAPANESGAGQ
ncbi:response regulator [Oxalobacteraceae bacterium OM1]|nr:response regulator [Oxalobacteraceae bacterium OM1]